MILKVSASPHIRHKDSTASLMRDVCIALMPALLAACVIFGTKALVLTLVTVAACVFFEYLSRRIMKRTQSIGDWSAVVTGMLLAFNLPAEFPLWMAVVGAFFAIVLAKQCFGGLGKNFVNPALAARVLLMISFPQEMTHFVVKQKFFGDAFLSSTDLVSSATPLAIARFHALPPGDPAIPTLLQSFLGDKAGVIGEVSILALLIGAAYLLARKVIDISIPLAFIATTLVFVTINGQNPLIHLLSGGLVLGAFFMATDFVTNPITKSGKIIFGIGCGLLTGLIRCYGGMAEGVSFSILLMNILTPHIDRLTSRFPRHGKAHLSLKGKGGQDA